MRRDDSPPRPDWRRQAEARGFGFHTGPGGQPYWDESACYTFNSREIDGLEAAIDALHGMCLELVARVIDERLYALFLVPPAFVPMIESSWHRRQPGVYGRFDLAYDGGGPPKLLEYNADTPTSLLEAGVVQWDWLEAVEPGGDQFNSIDEKLVDLAWPAAASPEDGPVHFISDRSSEEDATTCDYMQDCAARSGLETRTIDLRDVGFNHKDNVFVGLENEPITTAFKLYPWEWLARDEFGTLVPAAPTRWVEPPWKMLLSAKAILPLLYEMFPGSPYLLEASFDPLHGDSVRKPVHAREGANVRITRGGRVVAETGGPYGDERAVVYQRYCPLFQGAGRYAVVGGWVVAGRAAGIGIREDAGPVTGNLSRFVQHRMG